MNISELLLIDWYYPTCANLCAPYTSYVDISKINKIQLLKALWENSIIDDYDFISPLPDFDIGSAINCINKYIGIYQRKIIKCNLSKNHVFPYEYDKYNGIGSFQQIVDNLKKNIDSSVS
jgi:hypothetical protein